MREPGGTRMNALIIISLGAILLISGCLDGLTHPIHTPGCYCSNLNTVADPPFLQTYCEEYTCDETVLPSGGTK